MKPLQCVIADDEPIARQILETYIEELPTLTLVRLCKDAFEVIETLQKEQVDLLFLDINMPKLTGLSLLKTLRQRPDVIITTAYAEYALEGFELSVTDYLLKPFSLERFIQAVAKVKPRPSEEHIEKSSKREAAKKKAPDSIFVKSDKKLIKVPLNDIHYLEAYGNYVKIHTEKMILIPRTLSGFMDKLPSEKFIQIHKSYAINFERLKWIEGNQLILVNDKKLPIGKSYRKLVLERIGKSAD